MSHLNTTGDPVQRCSSRNSVLIRSRRRDRAFVTAGGNGGGTRTAVSAGYYLLVGLTAVSAATALVLIVHNRKRWRQRFTVYRLPESWSDRFWHRRRRAFESDTAITRLETSAVERALASIGLDWLDLRCPPSNMVVDELHSSDHPGRQGRTPQSLGTSLLSLTVKDRGVNVSGRLVCRSSSFFLVALPPGEEATAVLGLFEALAARSATGTGDNSVGQTNNRRHSTWARFLCPYHGALRVVREASVEEGCVHVPGAGGRPDSRLFLVLGDPRHGLGSSRSFAIRMGADVSIPVLLQGASRHQDEQLTDQTRPGVQSRRMCREGMAADGTLAASPSVWGSTLLISLGNAWDRDAAPGSFEDVFESFFHEGVSLQGGRVSNVLSKLRALLHVCSVTTNDHGDNDNGIGTYRLAPATIIITFDTSQAFNLSLHDVGTRDRKDEARHGRRFSEYPRTLVSARTSMRENAVAVEGGGREVDVRVLEVVAGREGEEIGSGVRHDLRQMVRRLEQLRERARALQAPSPFARFPTRLACMPFAAGQSYSPMSTSLPRGRAGRRSQGAEALPGRSAAEQSEKEGDAEGSFRGSPGLRTTWCGGRRGRRAEEARTSERRRSADRSPSSRKRSALQGVTTRPRASWSPTEGGGTRRGSAKNSGGGGHSDINNPESEHGLPVARASTTANEWLMGRRQARSLSGTLHANIPRCRTDERGSGGSNRVDELQEKELGERKTSTVDIGWLGWLDEGDSSRGGRVRDPAEAELLDEIASTTSHLPRIVQRTVNVGLHMQRDARAEGRKTNAGERVVGALEGWKAAVEALDQSHRELQCYREVQSEASSAMVGALEATMATFRGQVLVMTAKNADWLASRAKRCQQNPQQALKVFKEAHLAVKSVVVLVGGDGRSGTRWRLYERHLLSIERHHLAPLLENLRLLVVAFDNMRDEDREDIMTVDEIITNRDWLLRIATICTSAERKAHSRQSRNALPGSGSRNIGASARQLQLAPTTPSFAPEAGDGDRTLDGGGRRSAGRNVTRAMRHHRHKERRESLRKPESDILENRSRRRGIMEAYRRGPSEHDGGLLQPNSGGRGEASASFSSSSSSPPVSPTGTSH